MYNVSYIVFSYFEGPFVFVLKTPKNLCICGFYLLIFTVLEVKTEKLTNLFKIIIINTLHAKINYILLMKRTTF